MPCTGKCFICVNSILLMNPLGDRGTLIIINLPLVTQPIVGGVSFCVQVFWMQNPCSYPPHPSTSHANRDFRCTQVTRKAICLHIYIVCIFYALKQLNFSGFLLSVFFSFFLYSWFYQMDLVSSLMSEWFCRRVPSSL